jgi:hypothetical protein
LHPRLSRRYVFCVVLVTLQIAASCALAGPPYFSDDPEPTETGHFEIYAFANGTLNHDGHSGAAGIDFNYGGLPDLQLTTVVPIAYNEPAVGGAVAGLGNVELAAKYRFLHQEDFGFDVAFFPRFFVPSASRQVGQRHGSLLLPIWIGRAWDQWSTFGGGGCAINRGGGSKDFCLMGWALTRQILPDLQIGTELYHQTADTRDSRSTTGVGMGVIYDITENYHLLAWGSPGIQNAERMNVFSWYAAVLFTF